MNHIKCERPNCGQVVEISHEDYLVATDGGRERFICGGCPE